MNTAERVGLASHLAKNLFSNREIYWLCIQSKNLKLKKQVHILQFKDILINCYLNEN